MNSRNLLPLARRGPLRVMFVETEMSVGGEETLLVEIIRRLDRTRFLPELCCLKDRAELGEMLAQEVPAHHNLIKHKLDFGVLGRLKRLMLQRQIDAVITVGTGGDKMFWGRLAAWRAGAPVIASAIHSTSYPNRVETANRLLAPLTDAFIAVAKTHARDIVKNQGCPAHKVRVIPNGVDVQRFSPRPRNLKLRAELGLPADAPAAGIVAVIRPEKNHTLFLKMAQQVQRAIPAAHFLVVGDGKLRPQAEATARRLGVEQFVHFCGNRQDIPEILSALDLFVLTSDMEANPVSILEAMALAKPVLASRVGSIPDSVEEGQTGLLANPRDLETFVRHATRILGHPELAQRMGQAGRRRVVENFSVAGMVRGYEELITDIYRRKSGELSEPNEIQSTSDEPIREPVRQ